ncbi:MAG: hypothetical protein WC641_07315 [Patescibacteria group bacterium]
MPRSTSLAAANSSRRRPAKASVRLTRSAAEAEPRRSYAFTVLLTLVLFLALGSALALLDYSDKLNTQAQALAEMQVRLDMTEQTLVALQGNLNAPASPSVAPTTPPPVVTSDDVSPGGLLHRGSRSPDGTKYAGYDDTTAGKKGIGVEILASGAVKHIVIFARSEASGTGTPQATELGVRWKSDSVIQYDVLVTKNGQQTKQTEDVEIYF